MATLKNLYALMILLVVNVTLLPWATFATGRIPDCGKGMTVACGYQLFQTIVLDKEFAPTNECCSELVNAGKNCQNEFLKLIISTHMPIQGTISDLYQRGNDTWEECSDALYPDFPSLDYGH